MTVNRRTLFSLLGGLSTGFFSQAGAQPEPWCKGTVTGLAGGTVDRVESNTGVTLAAPIRSDGSYQFLQQASRPYLLIFRNEQRDPLREVKYLTQVHRQTISVTVDSALKTFDAVYDAIQVYESILALAVAATDQVSRDRFRNLVQPLPAGFTRLRTAIKVLSLSAAAQRVLSARVDALEELTKAAQ